MKIGETEEGTLVSMVVVDVASNREEVTARVPLYTSISSWMGRMWRAHSLLRSATKLATAFGITVAFLYIFAPCLVLKLLAVLVIFSPLVLFLAALLFT